MDERHRGGVKILAGGMLGVYQRRTCSTCFVLLLLYKQRNSDGLVEFCKVAVILCMGSTLIVVQSTIRIFYMTATDKQKIHVYMLELDECIHMVFYEIFKYKKKC